MVFTITNIDGETTTNNNNVSNNNKGKEVVKVWKQLLHVLLASIPFFTHGVESTELTSSVHSGHFIPSALEAVPWSTTALILAATASAPIYCWMVDGWGRKSGVYLISLAQGASCIPLFLNHTEISVILLHILAGVSSAGLFTVLPAYIKEISHDNLRDITLSFPFLLVLLGCLTHLVLDDEAQMFLMVALIAAQFLSLLVLVESPGHLLRVGKDEKAKKSLANLYSENEGSSVLRNEMASIKEEINRAKTHSKMTLWRILKRPLYRDVTKVGVVLNTVLVLSGNILFLEQDKALEQMKMPVDPVKTLTLVSLSVGGFVAITLVKFVERKYILTLAFGLESLSLGVVGVHAHIDLTVATLRWLPVVALAILISAFAAQWMVSLVIVVEMLNLEIRAKILALLFVYNQLLKLLHLHTFSQVVELMGLHTLFYVFACINMFGAVYAVFIVPDVNNKTIRQIEKQMKRIPLLQFRTGPIKA